MHLETRPFYCQFKETRVVLAQEFCFNENGCILMQANVNVHAKFVPVINML